MTRPIRFLFIALLTATLTTFGGGELRLLADLNPGAVGSFPSNITVFANSVYFGAYTLETGRELFRYDGTNITLVADINETKDDMGGGVMEGNDSLPSWLTPFNGALYFSAYDPRRGAELWKLNGTVPARVADISPDVNDTPKFFPNSSWPAELTVLNNALYFSANSGTTIDNYELWKFDGVSTSRVANIYPDLGTNYSSFPNGLSAFNGALYFMVNDGSHGYELWKHDGAGTIMLSDINPGGPESSSFPKNFTALNNELIFSAVRDDVGYEAWKTDGTNVTLLDINPGPDSSFPDHFTPFNGAVYFRASDPMYGSELWKYDGATTKLAFDINPAGDSFPKNLTVFGPQLVFAANDGVNGWELWKSDGATAQIITNLNVAGDSFPETLVVLKGVLYFTATTPETGYEIWAYDGTNVTIAADINPGPGDSFPQFLTVYNNSFLFRAAADGATDWEPWIYTPTAAPPAFIQPRDLTIDLNGSEIRLQWTTSPGSTNIVQAAADISGAFQDISGQIIPTGSGEVIAEFRETIAVETEIRFYRVKRL
jgi:ELWxxDGT repeat protein